MRVRLLGLLAFMAALSHPAVAAAPAPQRVSRGSCVACHASQEALDASRRPAAPSAQPLKVDEAFVRSAHNLKGCTSCHGGDARAAAKAGAHKGMVGNPLAKDGGKAACGQCHPDILERHKGSLHYTTAGIRNAFFGRLREVDPSGKLSKSCYRSKACVDCHASCSSCHITRPRDPWITSGPKGLLAGHRFLRYEKREDTEKTCYVCHAGSIADPDAGFQKHDVHAKAGMGCLSCHNEKEVHGDGKSYPNMIGTGAVSTECVHCHAESSLKGQWHSKGHLDRAACQSCHTMPYRSCTECHGWQRIIDKTSYPFKMTYGIKLGLAHGKLTTLVKAPVDTQMLADEGVRQIPGGKLNTQSSWYAGVPHSVVRPAPDQALCDRCHGPATGLLKSSDLQFPDHEKKQLLAPLPAVQAPARK